MSVFEFADQLGFDQPTSETTSRFPQFPMPFNFTTLNADQLANKYYNNNSYYQTTGLKVYADAEAWEVLNDSDPEKLNEVILYSNQSYKEFNDFDLVLFTSADGVSLLQQSKEVEVKSNQIVVFLELDGKINFGKIMRVQIGSGILAKKNLPYSEIIAFAQGKDVNISSNRIRRLLKKGVKSKENLFKWVLSAIGEALSGAVQFITGGIGDVFFKIIPEFIDEKIRIKEASWNPREPNFNPIFIPKGFEDYVAKQQERNNGDEKIIKTFLKPFFNRIRELEKESKDRLNIMGHLLPERLIRKIEKALKFVFDKIQAIEDYLLNPKFGFLDLILTGFQVANAFLCGFYNTIVDIITGIFQLVGLIFLGIKETTDFADNAGYYASISIEFIENTIEGIFEIDFDELFIQMIWLPLRISKSIFEFVAKQTELTIQEVFYFVGYILGFVVETVISILFTGGTLSIPKVLSKTFKEPIAALLKGFKSGVEKSARLIEKVIEAVKSILKALKEPQKLIDDFVRFVEDLFGVGKKVVDDVVEALPGREEWQQLVNDVESGNVRLRAIGKSLRDFTRHTNYSEIKAILHYESRAWTIGNNTGTLRYIGSRNITSLDEAINIAADTANFIDEPIRTGIDGVYAFSNPPPYYIISEVKYNTKGSQKWKAALSKKITSSGGSQMQREWIEFNLLDSVTEEIYNDILIRSYESILTSVTNGRVISQQLDDMGQIINNTTNFLN